MRSNPTGKSWEQLICARLQAYDPVRSRWLQEHPRRGEVLAVMIDEAAETLAGINDPSVSTATFWASIQPADRPDEVAMILVDSVELWAELDEAFPNPPPPPEPPPPEPLPGTLPSSGPIRRGWFPPV